MLHYRENQRHLGSFQKTMHDTVFGTTQCEHMATQNNFTPVHQREVSLAGTLGWCDPRYDFSTRGALEHFQKIKHICQTKVNALMYLHFKQ